MSEAPRRRRRVRSADSSDDAASAADPTSGRDGTGGVEAVGRVTTLSSAAADEPVPWVAEPVGADTLPAERGLRGLVGGGSSQISPTAALRARDAARPRPPDIARAETHLDIVRRNWSPRE